MVTAAFLLAAAYLLPGVSPFGMGWLAMLLPLPVFYYLMALGPSRCTVLFRNSLILGILVALLSQMVYSFLFSLTMAPVGLSLYGSVRNREDYCFAGFKAVIVLAVIWGGFWLLMGLGQETSPYAELLKMLDETFVQAGNLYGARTDIPVEAGMQMTRAVSMMRRVIPVILPGILAGGMVMTVWVNLVLANRMLHTGKFGAVWPSYGNWRLPERIVWVVIAAGIAVAAGSGAVRFLGVNVLIVMGLVYLFQGLAIMVYFFEKWSVPRFLKIALYLLLALQSYGLIILALLGLADVWLDMRKLEFPTA